MHSSANKLVELAQSRQLLSDDVIVELHKQLAESRVQISAEMIARVLVEHGHLTKFQASKLLGEIGVSASTEANSYCSTNTKAVTDSQVAEVVWDDEMPDDYDPFQEAATGAPLSVARPPMPPVSPQPDIFSKPVRSSATKANPWDSFRIMGVAMILALVGVAGFFLVSWLLRGSAEDAIKRADTAYQQRSYETAANMYGDFSETWPAHEMASYAKIRKALSLLRKDVEGAPNPVVALRTAESVLPTIATEPKMAEQQSDLAGVLVSLAEKFSSRIDATKPADQRKSLTEDNEKLLEMINDPQLFGSVQRTQLAPTLQRIEEGRLRHRREIQRDDELTAALAELDQQLETKQVAQAYLTRRKLIDRYPLLEANELLAQRVLKASEIQRELVKDGSAKIHVSAGGAENELARTFVMAEQSGQASSAPSGSLTYVRVKGAVYAIDARSGEVRWRRLVGRSLEHNPIRLADSGNSDVLVTEPEPGKLHRLIGDSGKSKWTVELGDFLLAPQVDSEEIFAATQSGMFTCLDAVSGQPKWTKQLPQPISVSPSVSLDGRLIFQPAEHSNIYSLDRRDGNCAQVYYLGHREGAIRIPPVQLLGHLFVIENINSDSARIRILAMTEQGLVQGQNAITIEGNVRTQPLIDRRQLLVQSDLGNTLVLEVDPAATKDKVSVIGRVPRNLDQPQSFWSAFEKNKIWLAEKRLSRFDLDVSQGKLNRKWNQYEGDEFVGPLQLAGEIMVHARRPLGNQGIRVGAMIAEDGKQLWEVEVGAPITLLSKAPDERFDVVCSSGAYYALSPSKPILNRAELNIGQNRSNQRYSPPTWISPTHAVMLNAANPAELAIYQADDNPRLRTISISWGTARPTTDAVAVGNLIAIGLDNGQLVLVDHISGKLVGVPYQAAALQPAMQVTWNRPVYLPSSQTLIAASSVGQIVRLATDESLRALASESMESPLVGPLAAIGNRVAAIESSSSGDQLVLVNADSLKIEARHPLDAGIAAGPFAVEQSGVLQTEQSLVAFDESGRPAWTIDFPNSQLVGPPVASGGSWVLATRLGQIWVIDPQNGQVLGSLDLGLPLTTVPLVLQKRLLIGSDEGAVLAVPLPTQHTLSGSQR